MTFDFATSNANPMINFYEVLDISATASKAEIEQAFRKKAKEYHPDVNHGSKAAEDMFKWLLLAKDTLLDDARRLEHDFAVGIRTRPQPQSSIHVQVENNVGQIVGWALLAFVAGLALGNSGSKT